MQPAPIHVAAVGLFAHVSEQIAPSLQSSVQVAPLWQDKLQLPCGQIIVHVAPLLHVE